MGKKNSCYNLYTKDELPDYAERTAVNCFFADKVACTDKMVRKCKQDNYPSWRKCPKQTGKEYTRKES